MKEMFVHIFFSGSVTPSIYSTTAIAGTISCLVITIVGPMASENGPV